MFKCMLHMLHGSFQRNHTSQPDRCQLPDTQRKHARITNTAVHLLDWHARHTWQFRASRRKEMLFT